MYIIIIGGGRLGYYLLKALINEGHEVLIVERDSRICKTITDELGSVCFRGDGCEGAVLSEVGTGRADMLVAVTGDDEDNLVACQVAKHKFNVPRTIARVNYPRNAWLFDQKFHVDVALSQAEILASLIEEEMSLGDMMTLLKLRRGHYSLVEEKVPPGAKAIGIPIKDLALPEQCVIAAIIRRGEIMLPRGITTLEVGDEVLAITDRPGADQLVLLLAPPAANRPSPEK